MNTFSSIRIGIIGLVFSGFHVVTNPVTAAKIDAALLAEVEKYMVSYFEKQPDYSPEYLITREQAAPLLGAFRQRGWDTKMLDSLASRMVSKQEFLARVVDSPEGRKFMKRIAKFSQGYDRLDRLSCLPLGHQLVNDMIYKVGGEDLIEYLTTSSGGKELGKMLARDPGGKNFNEPTGRIYTVPMLVKAFKEEILKKK